MVEWGPFDKKSLKLDFFKDIVNATVSGIPPQNFEEVMSRRPEKLDKPENVDNLEEIGDGKYGETVKPILAVYSAVRKQFQDVDLSKPEVDTFYWSSEQMGPTCVPNSYWSLARVILSEEQFSELRTDARIRYFQRNYQKIASGEDRSSASLLHAIEQVNALLSEAEGVGSSVKLFQNIRQDLLSREGGAKKLMFNNNPFEWENLPDRVNIRQASLKKGR